MALEVNRPAGKSPGGGVLKPSPVFWLLRAGEKVLKLDTALGAGGGKGLKPRERQIDQWEAVMTP